MVGDVGSLVESLHAIADSARSTHITTSISFIKVERGEAEIVEDGVDILSLDKFENFLHLLETVKVIETKNVNEV